MKLVIVLTVALLGMAPLVSAEEQAGTSVEDQVDVALTAYNEGLGLVRDTRELTLPTGELLLDFRDVAERIKPETVSLKSLASEESLTVFEQNYEYDLMSPSKLQEKYVGEMVKLVSFSEEDGFETVEARLLSVNEGPIYEVDGEIYLGHPGEVVLPDVPEDLRATPTLVWLLDNALRNQELELTYLTEGISWKADYVINLARDDRSMDLTGWITMDNQSGATYEDAELKLVAGDVHQVQRRPEANEMRMMADAASAEEAEPAQQEAFAEYHLYTIPRRTTIRQNQQKQVLLLEADNIVSDKHYELQAPSHFFRQQIGTQRDLRPEVYIEFANEEGNNLGMPLPAGIMRVYQQDSAGMPQFAGEDRIDHTPRDEDVRLKIGSAFDVLADRVQKDFTRVSDRVTESSFEITLRNHKDADVTVDVVENIQGDWEILDSSHEYEHRDARTAVFSLDVPSRGETVLTYDVRVRW
ncbi:MAG: DUF4139 domain-containing protein [Candidatus Hydrogenedentota bacterium]